MSHATPRPSTPRTPAQLAAIVRRGDHVLVDRLIAGTARISTRGIDEADVDAAVAAMTLDGHDPLAIRNRVGVTVARTARILGTSAARPAQVAS